MNPTDETQESVFSKVHLEGVRGLLSPCSRKGQQRVKQNFSHIEFYLVADSNLFPQTKCGHKSNCSSKNLKGDLLVRF